MGNHTIYGIQASTLHIDPHDRFVQPAPENDGKIKTLNAMGYMTPDVDVITQDFIHFASIAPLPVLDIGAAYGVATILALKKGATVIANDIDPRHLTLIAQNETLSQKQKSRLFLKEGAVPDEVDFPEHSLSALLLCRVMHFFTPEQIDHLFEKATRWLMPQGRLYIVTMTPYHYVLAGFSSIYAQRLREGIAWPGVITTMTTDYGVEHLGKIPEYLHVLDPRVMLRVATEHGFMVKRMELFGHHRNPDPSKDNDMGYLGAILVNQGL